MVKKFFRTTSFLVLIALLFSTINIGGIGGVIQVNAAADTTITLTCDDVYDLYLNGSNIGTGNNWREAKTYNLNLDAGKNVISVKATDTGVCAGLLAELKNGENYIISNTSWKTSSVLQSNWNSKSFNDENWANANDFGAYGVDPWKKNVNGFSPESCARWIWHGSTNSNTNINPIYFRLTLEKTTDENGIVRIRVSNPISSVGQLSGINYAFKNGIKDMPKVISDKLESYLSMEDRINGKELPLIPFKFTTAELPNNLNVNDILVDKIGNTNKAIKITNIIIEGNTRKFEYVLPDENEVFENLDIPLQAIELTEENFVPLNNSTSMLKSGTSEYINYEKSGGTHKLSINKTILKGTDGEIKASGEIKLLAPKLNVEYNKKKYDISLTMSEEANVKLSGDYKLKKDFKYPIYGIDVKGGKVAGVTLGIFLVVGIDGQISFEVEVVQKYSITAGVKGENFLFIPISVDFYSQKTKTTNVTCNIKGSIKVHAGLTVECSLSILGKKRISANIFLVGEATAKSEYPLKPYTLFSLNVDLVFKGEGKVRFLGEDRSFTFFNVRENLYKKNFEIVPSYGKPNAFWGFRNGSAADVSGNGNNGSLTAGYSTVTGKYDQALSFTNNSYMDVPGKDSINFGTGDFTIAMWLKTDSQSPSNNILDKRGIQKQAYHMILYNGSPLIQLCSGETWRNYYITNKKVNDGSWHHIAFTVDRDNSNGLKIYVDGELQSTQNPTIFKDLYLSSSDALRIGSGFSGNLDEICIYKKILTQDEIKDLK